MADDSGAIAPISAEQARALLAAIVESSDDAIVSKTLDGTVTTWNGGAERLYGYSAQETLGRHISFLIPDDRYQEYLRSIETVRRGGRLEHQETVRLSKEGRLIEVSLTLSPVLEADGSIVGVSSIARDISERKREERQLRESEKRYCTLIEMAPEAVVVHQDGRFVYANCAALGVYGAMSVQQLQQAPLIDLVHPDEREAVRARIQQLLEGEEIPLREYRLRRLNGEEISVEASSTLIDYQGRPSIQIIARQITERKKAERERKASEEALRRSEQRFRLMTDSMPQIAWTANADGSIDYINAHFEAYTGLGRESAEVRDNMSHPERLIQMVAHPDDAQRVVESYLSSVRRGEIYQAECRVRRVDGAYHWHLSRAIPARDEEGRVVKWYGTATDVHDLREAQEALRASEVKFRRLYESNLVAIFFWNRDGRITEANQAYCDLVGYGVDECKTAELNWLDATPRECISRDYAALEEVKERGVSRPYEKEFVNRKDGQRVCVLTAVARMAGSDAEGIAFAVDLTELKRAERALKDEITERVRAVEALAKQEQLLIRQGRLAAMGEMIGNIAHQWRQPLNTLALIVQELPRFYERNMFSKEYLDANVTRAMQVINHMSKTIDGFRNFIGPDKEKEEFKAEEVLTRTVSIVEAAFGELQLKIEMSADQDIVIYGCPNEFSQVILNILVNAKDALIERRILEPRVMVRLFREKEKMVLTISDNAGGIPLEIMDRIFDPYFTTKGPDKGTGIGLFMSKTIIEKNMNGTLTARNTELGAEFRIEV